MKSKKLPLVFFISFLTHACLAQETSITRFFEKYVDSLNLALLEMPDVQFLDSDSSLDKSKTYLSKTIDESLGPFYLFNYWFKSMPASCEFYSVDLESDSSKEYVLFYWLEPPLGGIAEVHIFNRMKDNFKLIGKFEFSTIQASYLNPLEFMPNGTNTNHDIITRLNPYNSVYPQNHLNIIRTLDGRSALVFSEHTFLVNPLNQKGKETIDSTVFSFKYPVGKDSFTIHGNTYSISTANEDTQQFSKLIKKEDYFWDKAKMKYLKKAIQ